MRPEWRMEQEDSGWTVTHQGRVVQEDCDEDEALAFVRRRAGRGTLVMVTDDDGYEHQERV